MTIFGYLFFIFLFALNGVVVFFIQKQMFRQADDSITLKAYQNDLATMNGMLDSAMLVLKNSQVTIDLQTDAMNELRRTVERLSKELNEKEAVLQKILTSAPEVEEIGKRHLN